jgi:hypothetical protein
MRTTAPSLLSEFGVSPLYTPALLAIQHYRSSDACIIKNQDGHGANACITASNSHSIQREPFRRLEHSELLITRPRAMVHPWRAKPSIYQTHLMKKEPDARLGHTHAFIPSTPITVVAKSYGSVYTSQPFEISRGPSCAGVE